MSQPAIFDHATQSSETFTATMMTTVLWGTTAFLGLVWAVVIPFLAVNKVACVYLAALMTVCVLVAPYLLLRSGLAVWSVRAFVAGGAVTATILGLLMRGGVNNIGPVGQLAYTIMAGVVLGRRAAAWVAVPCLAADLANAVAEVYGHPLPIVFPGTPFGIWAVVVLAFTITAFPLDRAVRELRKATEQVKSQLAERRKAEEQLRLIAETVPVGIVVLDLSGRIVFSNGSAAQVMGPDIGGRHHDDPAFGITDFAGNPLPPEQRPFRQVLARGLPVKDAELAVHNSNGQRIYLSVSAAPMTGARGELDGVVAALEDITGRRELEERYLHAQKMESLGRLAGGVAHDFNNLLTVINGYSKMLLDDPALTALQRGRVEQIAKVGESAKDLCQQLLAFSRKQAAEPTPLVVNDVVRDVEKMLRQLLGDDIELILHLNPAVGTIVANAGQVQQALLNLVLNARDAMPEGGRLTIATANISRSAPDGSPAGTPSAPYVQLTVEDTGIGMDESIRQHVFEPFFTTKPAGKGTGLGLSSVYGIVGQNGGWVRVESEAGKGTQFSLYFPNMEPPLSGSPAQAEVSPEGGSETVLVVEDHASVRRFLVECLQILGYTVLDATSGGEAIALLERVAGRVDLMITDMNMPRMSGKKLMEVVEGRWPGMRVLVVSSYSEDDIRLMGVAGPRVSVLAKPASVPELAAAMRGLLNR